jgi:glycosyltransferase involved in cell wall biosynthesis
MTLRFSIITPSYNQARYIQRTIESVLAQDRPASEYLVVDGGSSDQTVDILRRYSARLEWLSEPDDGHANAVNKGIRRTTGDVVGWLNSDDMYYPGALHKVARFLEEHPTVDVVYGDANHIDENDTLIDRYPTQEWDYKQLREICFISQPAAFFRRRTVQKYGVLDETVKYCIDYDYWLRLARGGASFAYLPKLLAATRLHGEAATLVHRVACHADINDVTQRHFGRTPDRWLFNYAHAVVENRDNLGRGRSAKTLMLAATAVFAAIRWNHAISAPMLATLSRWIVADATAGIRQRASLRRAGR